MTNMLPSTSLTILLIVLYIIFTVTGRGRFVQPIMIVSPHLSPLTDLHTDLHLGLLGLIQATTLGILFIYPVAGFTVQWKIASLAKEGAGGSFGPNVKTYIVGQGGRGDPMDATEEPQ